MIRTDHLPLEPETHVAMLRAFLHCCPAASRLQQPPTEAEYYQACNLIIKQACLALHNLPTTSRWMSAPKGKGKGKGKKKPTVIKVHNDQVWPPAFDARPESDDERFARLLLAAA